ncbi:glycogen debranching protein GlgX [Lichenibacterium ramalinae]|uniref:4-alpha-glucanotransferase n=1 Tax=Lichenibacterium ramalinae TaxID=2316527 RepID=A0A4Q2RG44_9HYPH|nr:glycogen debranching protein GlgX [Lichenibacterium ramalinae]RYB05937.1 glycogen debranching enzyme GlgX [Lichenibacterium ramalinae]
MLNDGQADISASPAVQPGPGRPEPLGVTPMDGGVNVAVFSAHADAIVICLYDAEGGAEQSRFTLPERTGDVFHGFIPGVQPGTRYGLRARGPWEPWNGHRFNDAKLLIDPYARALDRPLVLDDTMFDSPPGSAEPDRRDSGPAMPKGIVLEAVLPDARAATPTGAPAWSGAPAWPRTSIAEVHVRGFSKLNPDVPEEIRGTFAGLASPAGIAHFKALGITTLELMPAMAWADERHLGPLGLTNVWGYNPVALLAPDPRLAPGGWAEVRAAVAALHEAGIEVLLDVVYNHSGEGDEHGPTLCFRGLDNASYYRLDASDPSRYVNDAGCGNVLDAESPAVVRLVLDSLRAWARDGGIDGFRFDLMPVLGRRRGGFDPHAPIIAAIAQDPVLRRSKLVAEAWDIGPGGYQVGRFDALWGEWNDRYRDDVRAFWTGRAGPAALAGRVTGSADLFAAKRHPSRSVNFVTAHDGFTLADLVSYDGKHNAANGEGNRDGRDENLSWNHGVEGPTEDRAILAARARDQRNLLATLFLSRGTPMIGPGTEAGHTQGGNNNAYSQDNATTWLDWSRTDSPLRGFIRRLIDLRAAHPALTHDAFPTGAPVAGSDLPDVAWRLPDGRTPAAGDWENPATATLIGVLAAPGRDVGAPPDRILLAFHAGSEALSVALPEPRPGWHWLRTLDTAAEGAPSQPGEFGEAALEPRSVVLLVEREGAPPRRVRRLSSEDVLDTLSEAAGVAPEWFAATGRRQRVSPDTKRALLRAMGLEAGTDGEARDSLARLSDRRLRPLPPSIVGHTGTTVAVDVMAEGLSGRHALLVRREDGSEETYNLDLDGGERGAFDAPDGRRGLRVRLALPPQPAGRHRLLLDGDAAGASLMTVAPRRCFIPADYRDGRRGFGVSAHLYTLRRRDDGGIGDFTTLGIFAEETARHGGDFVGLNPMHAQFAADRDRASPYNPSDRRFLDPAYLDVTAPAILGETPEAARILDSQAGRLADLRAVDAVDYTGVWAAKSAVLEAAFAGFDARRAAGGGDVADFERFLAAGGEALRRFAIFESIAETVPRMPWQLWDASLREPTGAGIADFASVHGHRVRYHLWLQWQASVQFAGAAARAEAAGLALGFYRDIAVGTAPDGAEAWAEAGNFARGVSVGAPPDPFSATGQVWSLPPPNPVAEASTMFATLLSANMRHAGALRIDHAMGLQRLFWVPDGASGAQGAYVGYDLERNLADVALESHRARCLVIGEDLGTVPDGFRDRLDAADVLSYRVMFFERDGLNFLPGTAYPAKAVACVATHDLPTLAGWWEGADYRERGAIGHMPAEEAAKAEADRVEEKHRFAEAVGVQSLEGATAVPREVIDAAHRFVADTPCILAVAQAEDLVGETVAVNLPGTSHERPNWQRKLAPDVSEIFAVAGGSLPKRRRGDGLEM